MNCRESFVDLALYVEGDLSWRRIEEIEKHLMQCRACRVLADELQQTQTELRQLRNEVVDSATLHRIRAGVLAQVQTIESQRTWLDRAAVRFWGAFRLRYVITACLVLGIAGATIWQWRRSGASVAPLTTSTSVAAVSHPVIETSPAVVADIRPAVRHVARKAVHGRRRPAAPPREDLVVQIQTDDPNIVIYWLIDQNTGGF